MSTGWQVLYIYVIAHLLRNLKCVLKRSRNMCAMTGLNILSLVFLGEGVRRTGEGDVGYQSNIQHEIDCHPELVSGSHQMLQLACTGSEESHNDLKSLYKAQVAGAAATLPKRTYLQNMINPLTLTLSCNGRQKSPSHFTFHSSLKKRAAFTLAEVLITIGIIGIVAAMTMPSLIANYQKKQTAVRLERFYSIMSQAILRWQQDEGIMPEDIRFPAETAKKWCKNTRMVFFYN